MQFKQNKCEVLHLGRGVQLPKHLMGNDHATVLQGLKMDMNLLWLTVVLGKKFHLGTSMWVCLLQGTPSNHHSITVDTNRAWAGGCIYLALKERGGAEAPEVGKNKNYEQSLENLLYSSLRIWGRCKILL